MVQPINGTGDFEPVLSELIFEYDLAASQNKFIGDKVLPPFLTAEKSGKYPKIPIEQLLKLPDTSRTPSGGYNRGSFEFAFNDYDCEENGREEPVGDVEQRLYGSFFNASEVAAQKAADVVRRRREKRVADLVFNTSNISNENVSIEWSTITATPKSNILTAKAAIRLAGGPAPTTAVIPVTAFNNAMITTEVKASIMYSSCLEYSNYEAQRNFLAQYFGFKEILIADAIYDSASEGQSFSAGEIWDDEYILLFSPPTKILTMSEPCLGRTMVWQTDTPQSLIVESYYESQTRANIIRARDHVDEVFVLTEGAYLLGNITA